MSKPAAPPSFNGEEPIALFGKVLPEPSACELFESIGALGAACIARGQAN